MLALGLTLLATPSTGSTGFPDPATGLPEATVGATVGATAGATTRATAGELHARHDALGSETWFDSISVSGWPDEDRDGYASGLSVTLDADTTGRRIEAYARLALSGSDGVERLLYDTTRFTLQGRSSQDRVDAELDLLDAFPTDRYDLVIELRDERSGALLDVVDRGMFVNLGGIALEDAWRDGRHAGGAPVNDAPTHGHGSSSYVAVDYAGAGGPLAIAFLAVLAALRRHRACATARMTDRATARRTTSSTNVAHSA